MQSDLLKKQLQSSANISQSGVMKIYFITLRKSGVEM